MKRNLQYIFLLFIFALFTNISYPQWVQTNGPGAGMINCFMLSGPNIFAGCGVNKGIYLSTNNGTNWTTVNAGLNLASISNVYALTKIGSNIFAGVSASGVYLSTNNGSSWTAANTGIATQNVQALAVMGSNLFAGTSSSGAYISTDNGSSWTAISNGLPNANVKSLSVFGTTIYAGMTAGGLYISTDNGSNWTAANTGISGYTVSAIATNDGVNLFASTTNNGAWYSTNGGTSWSNISAGLAHANVYSLNLNGTNLFAGTFAGVSFSTNNGSNWTTINSGIPLSVPAVNALLFNGSTLFLGSSSQGIFASTNNGTSWSWSSNGLTNSAVICLLPFGSNLFAGTSVNGVVVSTDGGNSWSESSSGLTGNTVYFILNIGNNIFCAPNNKGVWLSTNNGTSWSDAGGGALTTKALRGFVVGPNGTDLFAGEFSSGVWKSTNNGTSWVQTNTGLPANNIRALYVKGSNIYAGINNAPGGICLSTDNGATWSVIGLTGKTVQAIYYIGDFLYAGTSGSGIWRSSDNGTTWTQPTGYAPLTVNAFISDTVNFFCSGNSYGTIFQSTDQGSNWKQIDTGLVTTNGTYGPLAFHSGSLYLGTGANGVWRRSMLQLPVELVSFTGSVISNKVNLTWKTATEINNRGYNVERSKDSETWNILDFVSGNVNSTSEKVYSYTDAQPLQGTSYYRLTQIDLNGQAKSYQAIEINNDIVPGGFQLLQNYPDPFNPSTKIQFQLPVTENIKLAVYDLTGREITVLMNERLNAGKHEVTFNASKYASGVYFYRLTAGSIVIGTKRMILLK